MFRRRCGFIRPRPMCCMAPMPRPLPPGPVIPIGGGCQVTQGPCEVVVEPALVAAPNVFHHHKSVQHIQPVITQDIHHCHTHHKYFVEEQKTCDKVVKHAHGLCGPAMTQPAQPCCPSVGPMCC